MAKNKKVNKTLVASIILVSLGNVLFFFTIWLLRQYDHIYLDQVLFQMKAPASGANRSLALTAIVEVGVYGIALTVFEVFLYRFLGGKMLRLAMKFSRYAEYCASRFCRFFKRVAFPFSLAMLVFACTLFVAELEVVNYISVSSTESDFIVNNYVDPEKVNIKFPEKKRNLIYIFLESMESTYADTKAGGHITQNFIPELSKLADENINFSATDKLGGALSYSGTTWTAAAMVSHTSGMLIKVPLASTTYGGDDSFMPGVKSLGEILKKEGYNQTVLVGSDSDFGGRKSYFKEHGNYKVVDLISLKKEGRLDQNYHEWWGFEDDKLFEYAKEEINSLYKSGKPFNFTMLTADTHFPNGYVCKDCKDLWGDQYANVLSCSSKKVYEFVNWIKKQPFYENTTVIVCGDHLTMDPIFVSDVNEDYTRTVYNCFINSAVEPIREKGRLFGTFDFFPTTLAAMGATIDGDRLGLGTNLFSSRETLSEIYGFEYLDAELQKKSLFYNEKILEMENPGLIF